MQGKDQDWSITLTPHRSLGRQGFVAVMVALVICNVGAGVFFIAAGAWPIFGFMGLDVALMWWAFRRNFADSEQMERIIARGDELRLERLSARSAPDSRSFNRRWVKVELEFDDARELVGRLYLRSHGIRHEIASFLGADERRSLATALRQAI
ncbi:MAG: DUF2244 domain-containing protein [Hyphomicrobiales bacterium]